jgi:hypothetical protein
MIDFILYDAEQVSHISVQAAAAVRRTTSRKYQEQ